MKKIIKKHFKTACRDELSMAMGLVNTELEEIIWEKLWQNLWFDFGMEFELNLGIKLREILEKELYND